MTKYLLLLLLVVLLAGCSVNNTAEKNECCCPSGCSMSQQKLVRNLDKYAIHKFEQNLSQWREETFWRVEQLDEFIAENEPPTAPDATFLRTLVSNEQMDAWHQLKPIEYADKLAEIRTIVSGFNRHCQSCYGIHPVCGNDCE